MPRQQEQDPAAILAAGLAELGASVEPLFEQALGMRRKMEADGWSPTAAEAAALTWLTGAMTMFWTAATAQAAQQ